MGSDIFSFFDPQASRHLKTGVTGKTYPTGKHITGFVLAKEMRLHCK